LGKFLKAAKFEGNPLKSELDKLLLSYRISPDVSTGFSTSLLFFNRYVKTGLPQYTKPLTYEHQSQSDTEKQTKTKQEFDKCFKTTPVNIDVED